MEKRLMHEVEPYFTGYNVGVLFVIDSPSEAEIRRGKLSIGGVLFNSLSRHNIASYGLVSISGVHIDKWDSGANLADYCGRFLAEDLTVHRQRITVPLGAPAFRFLNRDEGNITIDHGKRIDGYWNGIDLKLFPMITPNNTIYNPASRAIWGEDFRKLKEVLDEAGGENQ